VRFYDEYTDVPPEEVDALLGRAELGRLVTVSADGAPEIGLYPFLHEAGRVALHLHRADAQLAHLRERPRCLFEVDEVLAVIPSYWVHPESAVMATAYHRTAILDCEATVGEDVGALVEQQMRLMARYQPEGRFRAVTPEHPLYAGALAQIAAIELRVVGRRVKFKLGQNRPAAVRAAIARELRARGRAGDARAADALQWTIDREGGS